MVKEGPEMDDGDYFAPDRRWSDAARAFRAILLDCGLEETIKWGKPTYVSEDGNICILQNFSDFLALLFFKGALLDDPEGILKSQGENTRSALRVEAVSAAEVRAMDGAIRALVAQAKDVAARGLVLDKAAPEPFCDELVDALDADPELREAFEGLTPGRQRGYNLHFSGAKKSETRAARIDKHRPRILAGKGMHDR